MCFSNQPLGIIAIFFTHIRLLLAVNYNLNQILFNLNII